MAKTSLELASKGIDIAFASLKKEIKSYKNILDVSPRTLTRLLGDKGKSQVLRNELINAIGHSYIGAENNFIALTSTQKLNKAARIISKYTEDFGTDKLLGTRSEARGKLFFNKSSQAGNRLKGEVTKHINSIQQFTSPTLVSKVREYAGKKADTITLELKVPRGRKFKKTEKQALEGMKKGFLSGDSSDVSDLLKSKSELIKQTFLKGSKATVKLLNKKESKRTKKLNISSYNYIAPFYEDDNEEDETSLKYASVLHTLEGLINATVGRFPHMHPKGTRKDPDPNKLRMQSGRFANSVQIDYINPQITEIQYSYMADPYKLAFGHGGGRDPENIIEGAIREIMQARYVEERFFNTISNV